MIAEKIRSASNALGVLAGDVTPDQWALLSLVRAELRDAADQTESMENSLSTDLEQGIVRPGE